MLTERQLYIFKAIIELYSKDGQPVGSKTLLQKTDMKFSSATIRNEMSRLEELGLIEKTHTSSGRIPSLKGYRFYVDHMINQEEGTKEEQSSYIQSALSHQFQKMDDLIHHSADVLSKLTSYTAIVSGPEATSSRLTGFQLVPLNGRQAMAILLTDTGGVENMVFPLPENVEYADMEKMVRIIEDVLVGKKLIDVYQRLQTDIPVLIRKYARSAEIILHDLLSVFEQAPTERLHISGKTNLLEFTEHMDIQQVKSMYELMEDGMNVASLLTRENEDIDIKIGEELKNDLFSDFSLVTASYQIIGYGEGTLAVLGPTNMSYKKIIRVLNTFRKELPEIVLRFYLN